MSLQRILISILTTVLLLTGAAPAWAGKNEDPAIFYTTQQEDPSAILVDRMQELGFSHDEAHQYVADMSVDEIAYFSANADQLQIAGAEVKDKGISLSVSNRAVLYGGLALILFALILF